jgi:hypothetical protein
MTHVYRISNSPDIGDIVDTVEAIEAFARDHGPGRYHVDEHSLDPLPGSKYVARVWGRVIHDDNGQVTVKPFFFGDHEGLTDDD